jgi:hypothetical protein
MILARLTRALGLHIHDWSNWELSRKIEKTVPIGDSYPPDVRGKMFETTRTVQHRRCRTCNRIQVAKL